MKNFKLKKLIAVALVAMTIATISPIGASAAWKQDSNGWWNTKGNSWSTGWESIDGSWYYFGSNGYMKTGWANDNGTWYFMQPSGAMKTGWINDKGTWYYAAASGAMQTGWVNDGGTWYFTAASGAMQTGVVEVDGKVYYLAPSGAMATGAVTIGGVTYTFAASGEAIGDKIPTPTVAFTSGGTAATPSKPATPTPTPSTGGSSSGGGGGSHNNGSDANDITPLVSSIFSKKIASILENHPTLAKEISVNTTGNPIVVTLLDSRLESLEKIFNTAKGQDSVLIEARLAKAEEIMNTNSEMLDVNGGSFKEYLANGVESTYFKADGSLKTSVIAEKISDGTLTYDNFRKALKDRIIAKCNGTNPEVSVSYGKLSETVTKIQRTGTDLKTITIYDINSTVDENIAGLVSLGDTTTGTYTIYCGTEYFKVKVTK
ncbi:hypothetical protein DIC82_09640 [Clostridium beijerinckii]|nr:hypothetical protein DIC82_09640 [Clostridium beijerinckii]